MRVGIIGAGHIAEKMAKTLNLLDGVSAYAIASRSKQKAENFKSKFKFEVAYSNYEEMLKDPNVDLVYIATPHSCHYDQMELCLKYHKPVLCEKIITTTSKDTELIYEKFERDGLLVQEALWTSFLESRNIINDLIYKEKVIGEVTSMEGYFYCPIFNKERVKSKDLGGGVALDIGLYPITFILRTLGYDYKEMNVKKLVKINEVDAKEEVEFIYENGVKATAYVDGKKLPKLVVLIYGEKGKIIIDSVNCPTNIKVYNEHKKLIKKINCKPKYTGFEDELIACKSAIENNKIECEQWSHEDSIRLARILDKIIY